MGGINRLRGFSRFIPALLGLLGANAAAAAPTQWSTSGGGNGNYYQVVWGDYSWQQGQSLASGMTFQGRQGYLVTLTTTAEIAFVQQLVTATGIVDYGFAVGASDAANEGNWQWVSGPDAGTSLFFGGGQYPWATPQPDDFLGNQDYAVAFVASEGRPDGLLAGSLYLDDAFTSATGPFGAWSGGYIVEFDAPAAIPEPGTYALMLVGLGLVCGVATRRQAHGSSVNG